MYRPSRSPFAVVLGAALALTLALAPFATAETPIDRHEAWISSLQGVLDDHPDLTAEQVTTVLGAMNDIGPNDFVDRIGAFERERLNRHSDELASALSCQVLHDLQSDVSEDLGSWMEANRIAVAKPPCECGGGDDCAEGWECISTDCNSPQGTTHWGECRKKKTLAVDTPTGV